MLQKITMPDAGQTTDQLVVAKWLKRVGDVVARGDILLEVETDKATLAVESFTHGKLLKQLVQAGETASVGDVIALVGEEGDLASEETATSGTPRTAQRPAHPSPESAGGPSAKQPNVHEAVTAPGRVLASPAARKAARELGLDLAAIARSANKAVVRRADVLGFDGAGATTPAPEHALPDPGEYELLPLTRARRTIANRMAESATTIPAFTLEVEVDMTRCIALREELNAQGTETQIAYNDILAKCLAAAAERHSLVNASYRSDGIHAYKTVNVGLAVAREEGLVVTVVRDVAHKRLLAIARENAEHVAAARDGTLKLEEMEGGTITISNLGMYAVRKFTALINPPQSCILALGSIAPRPAWVDGVWVSRPTMFMTASFDHRVLDGAYGASFLRDLQALLERPGLLLL